MVAIEILVLHGEEKSSSRCFTAAEGLGHFPRKSQFISKGSHLSVFSGWDKRTDIPSDINNCSFKVFGY